MAGGRVDTRRRRGRKILGNRNTGHFSDFYADRLKSRRKAEARTLKGDLTEMETTSIPKPTPTDSAPLKWAQADESRIVIRDSGETQFF